MDQKRWNVINRIFHDALEVDPSERAALVATESNGDPELEEEIQLLLQADAEAGSYLESPLIPAGSLSPSTSPLAVGDILCGRFRIVRGIAEGGMGNVFEAFDSELSVRVALKVIRPEIASNPEAEARFRQEVRLARTITHPNVCRTFDLQRETRLSNGERTELVFLTMELLSGETLAARIKRDGKLSLNEALDLARQIAAALHAAHALKVIHRDMKPANIMLVPASSSTEGALRAVVTDFGLARLDRLALADGQSGFTNAGQTIGTLAYMAPEQLDGAAVSPATDIYTFGLILFEMITGERAFPSTNLLSGIGERLRGSLSLDRLRGAKVPVQWHHAIEGCLAVAPADRPQDAADVVKMLEGDEWVLHRFRISSARIRGMLPRVVALVVAFLISVALFASGLRLYKSRADSRVTPGALVYLTQVKNQTGEKSLDNLTELIQAGLSQSTQLNLLDQGRVGDILQQMTKSPNSTIDQPTAREIAMRAGAVRVIFATVTGSKGNYSLNVDVQQPDNKPGRYREHWAKTFMWQTSGQASDSNAIPPELLSRVRSASDWVRNEAGESAHDVAMLDVPPGDVTTDSWSALQEFVSAENLQARQKPADALIPLQNAVRIDPHFSLAYGRLGDLLAQLRRYQDAYNAYEQAFATDQDRRLSRRERDRIRGTYSLDSHDYAAAEEAFRDFTVFYDSDYRGWYSHGQPLLFLGRLDEAAASLQHAYTIDPSRGNAPFDLAKVSLAQGDLPAALHWADVLKQLGNSGRWNYFRGAVQFLSHQYDQAKLSFAAIQQSARADYRSLSFMWLAQLGAERGEAQEALKFFAQGIQEDRSHGNTSGEADKLIGQAYVEAGVGQFALAGRDVELALTLDASPQRVMSASGVLGAAIARATPHQARSLREQLAALEPRLAPDGPRLIVKIARHRVRGEVLLAQGDTAKALVELRTAAQLDAPIAQRGYLGRALELAAARASDPQQAHALREDAMDAYAAAALHPAIIYVQFDDMLPGSYGDQLASYVRLAGATAANNVHTQTAIRELTELRK